MGEKSFEKIKVTIAKLKSLQYFDVNQPVILECDASSTGLGVPVYKKDKTVEYASRTLTKTERNYTQIEKELLAIVFGCTRFDQLLAGNQNIMIKTDRKALITTFKKPLLKAPKRLQLILVILQRY